MCVCVCVCVKKNFIVVSKREKTKYFNMKRSTKRFVFLRIIYFVLTYVYVSSLLLSSEKMWHKAM